MTAKRIVFFGTPEFAVPTLQALIDDERFDVVAIVTQPDKPVGRKKELTAPPVKECAIEHDVPVLQPRSLKQTKLAGQEFLSQLKELQVDCAVLIAYGKIVPQDILDIPQHGFVNLHLSLLPQYRGASPLQQALLDGVSETGVTLMKMDAGMDTGGIIAAEKLTIDPRETSASLHERIGILAADVATRYVLPYIDGDIFPVEQDESRVSMTSLLKKTDGEIDWAQDAEYIDRHIRAMTPWPGAYTFCDELRVKILEAHIEAGQLVIDVVQPAGKKPMSFDQFRKGYPDCNLQPR